MKTDPQPPDSNAAIAPEPDAAPVLLRARGAGDLRRYLALGTGIGIEIRDGDLHVSIVKVRPWETGVLGSATVLGFRHRPAAEWGSELLAFLSKTGVRHIAATVLLPRTDVIVRQIHLPGVSNRDLKAAIELQLDSLHPFADDEIYSSWGRIGNTPYVLAAVSRREVIDGYSSLFAEAGIKVAAFTFSAAVLYSACRLITAPPPAFVAVHETGREVEVYGESPARPLYSAALAASPERAVAIGRSELRLEDNDPEARLSGLVPKPELFPPNHDPKTGALEGNVLAYATALAGACPWLGVEGNLLPADKRRASSRARLIPTFTLAGTLAVLLVMLAFQSSWADARYLGVLQHEIRKYEPAAKKVEIIDRATAVARARSQALDDFRRRAKLDMDALAEITRLVPPPGWVSNLEMDRTTVQVAGEVEQAAALLSVFDKSPLFDKSEFTMPISRSQTGELFRIRTQRQTPPLTVAAPPQQPAQPAPQPPAPGGAK